jgi:hypothetical protein
MARLVLIGLLCGCAANPPLPDPAPLDAAVVRTVQDVRVQTRSDAEQRPMEARASVGTQPTNPRTRQPLSEDERALCISSMMLLEALGGSFNLGWWNGCR